MERIERNITAVVCNRTPSSIKIDSNTGQIIVGPFDAELAIGGMGQFYIGQYASRSEAEASANRYALMLKDKIDAAIHEFRDTNQLRKARA